MDHTQTRQLTEFLFMHMADPLSLLQILVCLTTHYFMPRINSTGDCWTQDQDQDPLFL